MKITKRQLRKIIKEAFEKQPYQYAAKEYQPIADRAWDVEEDLDLQELILTFLDHGRPMDEEALYEENLSPMGYHRDEFIANIRDLVDQGMLAYDHSRFEWRIK